MWGIIIALLFAPLYRRLLPLLKRRRTLAALLTLMLVLLVVIFPLGVITAALAREAAHFYQQLQSGAVNPGLYFHGLFDAVPH